MITIIDYKSGSKSKNEEKISLHLNVQHAVYKKALEFLHADEEVKIDEVRFVHFFDDDMWNQEIILSDSAIAELPSDVISFVLKVIKESKYVKGSIAGDKLKENLDPCQYCTYSDICADRIGEKL